LVIFIIAAPGMNQDNDPLNSSAGNRATLNRGAFASANNNTVEEKT
jgi:hypothetical protein